MSLMGMLMQSEKAKLSIHAPEDGKVGPMDGAPIPFQFNPATLSVSKGSSWSSAKAAKGPQRAPAAQFTGPQAATLTVDLLLDANIDPNPDISDIVGRLDGCVVAHEPSTQKGTPTPKFVRFSWGSWKWGNGASRFEGYLTSLKTDYELFDSDGTPLRAKITMSITEFVPMEAGQNPTSGTLVPQRSRTLQAGDTLAWIAWEEYGDPTAWRVLAEANGIDDPMRVAPGTTVLVPRRKPTRERG